MRLKLGSYSEDVPGISSADIINTETGGVGGTIHKVDTFAGTRYMGFKKGRSRSCNSAGSPARFDSYFKRRKEAVGAVMAAYGVADEDWCLV